MKLLVLAYIAMLLADLIIFFGTFYCVTTFGWSNWAYLLMVMLLFGTSPKIYGITGKEEK